MNIYEKVEELKHQITEAKYRLGHYSPENVEVMLLINPDDELEFMQGLVHQFEINNPYIAVAGKDFIKPNDLSFFSITTPEFGTMSVVKNASVTKGEPRMYLDVIKLMKFEMA
jgi:hypothetical protein